MRDCRESTFVGAWRELKELVKIISEKGLGGFGYGKRSVSYVPLAISSFNILLVFGIGLLAKKFLESASKKVSEYVQEFLATWEVCATAYELSIVFENFGLCYYILIYLVILEAKCTLQQKLVASNYLDYQPVGRDTDYEQLGISTLIQVLAAVLTAGYFKMLTCTKLGKSYYGVAAHTTLRVKFLVGFIIEALGTMLNYISRHYIRKYAKEQPYLEASAEILPRVFALPLTGGFYSPMPAYARNMFFAKLSSLLFEYPTVYFAGPVLGKGLYGLIVREDMPPGAGEEKEKEGEEKEKEGEEKGDEKGEEKGDEKGEEKGDEKKAKEEEEGEEKPAEKKGKKGKKGEEKPAEKKGKKEKKGEEKPAEEEEEEGEEPKNEEEAPPEKEEEKEEEEEEEKGGGG